MFAFGHAGLTYAAARAVDREVDPRWAALLALGPDFVDKPMALLLPAFAHRNTRGLGHTAAFSFVVLAALLLWKRRPKTALVLWGCWLAHFLCDAMWRGDNPVILFWPLLGGFPPPARGPVFSWLTAFNVAAEIAGAIVVTRFVQRHGLAERGRLLAFLKNGVKA